MNFILFIALFLVVLLMGLVIRKIYQKKLRQAFQKKDYTTVCKILDSFFVKLLFQPFYVEMMRFNAYLALKDRQQIDRQVDLLMKSRLSKKQTELFGMRAYQYYIRQKDEAQCKRLAEMIQKTGNEQLYQQVLVMEDVYLTQSGKTLELLKEEYKKAEGQNKRALALLLAKQYENLHDDKNAEFYRKYAQFTGKEEEK